MLFKIGAKYTMIFSSLSKREKIIFIISCVLICISISYRIILEPIVKKWFGLNNQIAAKQVKLKKDIKLLNRYESIKGEYQKYASLIKGPQSDEQQMAAVLSEIENLARKSNVYVSALKPRTIKDADFYQRFIVELELDTSVADLMKFFYHLQGSPQLLKVESMEINAKSGQKDSIKAYLVISKILFKELTNKD